MNSTRKLKARPTGLRAMMEFSGKQGMTRRDLIIRAVGASAVVSGFAAGFSLDPNAAHAVLATQADWRFCSKCNGLFFSGLNGTYERSRQVCPAGDLHYAIGYNFVLPHDVPETATAQQYWRFCGTCNGMFFSGRDGSYLPENQRCPTGGRHLPLGHNFVLPHREVPPSGMTPEEQQIFDLVDSVRRQAGCAVAMQADPRLVAVARAHSQDLADHPGLWEKGAQGQQGHVGSDDSLSEARIRKAVGSPGTENSYVEWRIDGTGPPSAQAAFDWWWQSKYGHKENLLNCNHKTTGVGIAKGTGKIPAGQDNAGQSATFYYYTQAFVD